MISIQELETAQEMHVSTDQFRKRQQNSFFFSFPLRDPSNPTSSVLQARHDCIEWMYFHAISWNTRIVQGLHPISAHFSPFVSQNSSKFSNPFRTAWPQPIISVTMTATQKQRLRQKGQQHHAEQGNLLDSTMHLTRCCGGQGAERPKNPCYPAGVDGCSVING